MADNDVIERWTIEASQYHAEMKKISEELNAYNKGLKDTEQQAGSMISAFRGMADVAGAFTIAKAAIQATVGTVDKVLSQADRIASLQQAQGGFVTEAAAATKGLYTNTQLLELASKQAAIGANLSSGQFATLASQMTVLADATGREALPMVEAFTQALVTGRESSLRSLGVLVDLDSAYADYAKSIGVATDQLTDAEKMSVRTRVALEALAQATGGKGAQIGGTGDAWQAFKNSLSDVGDAMIGTADKAGPLTGVFSFLADQARDTAQIISQLSTSFKELGAAAQAGALAGALVGNAGAAGRAAIVRPERAKKRRAAGRGERAVDVDMLAALEEAGFQSRAENDNARRQIELQGLRAAAPAQNRLADLRGETASVLGDERFAADMKARRERMVAENRALMEELRAAGQDRARGAFAGTTAGGILAELYPESEFNRIADGFMRAKEQAGFWGETMQGVANITAGFAQGALGSFIDGIYAAIEGQKSFGEAMRDVFKAFLLTFSKQMALEALKYAAMGTAFAVIPGMQGSAGGLFAAAGLFTAAAVAAGVVGAAIPGGAKSSGAAGGRGVSRGVGGTASTGGGGASAGGTFIYNVNTITPPDKDQAAHIVAELYHRGMNLGLRQQAA